MTSQGCETFRRFYQAGRLGSTKRQEKRPDIKGGLGERAGMSLEKGASLQG